MKDYRKYLFEFVAIFLAITLSFLVDEIREQNQNDENYVYVLSTILSDLKSDTSEIKYPLKWSRQTVHNIDSILNGRMELEILNSCSKCRYSIMSYSHFNFNTTGFNLLNSGIELSQIENRELVAKILDFYSLNIEPNKNINEIINQNAANNLEYFRDNCSWYKENWSDSTTINEMSEYLLSDHAALSRTRHTQILLRDNFLPHLENLSEKLNKIIAEVENELNNK
jgi:hypothetical protein